MEDYIKKRFFPYSFVTGTLIERPNRFVVYFKKNNQILGASLPNPGKLGELFIPGAKLYLQMMRDGLKYPFRVIAVEAESGEIIMLDTHVNNQVAAHLIDISAIPSLRNYKVKRREVTVGHSRFDFLLENKEGEELYCEVKSSTLFGGELAMFPDAVTTRGKRHVKELTEMSAGGIHTAVLFIVQSSRINAFCPDYHTDPQFSRTLYESRNALTILPVTAGWNDNLDLISDHRELPVLWSMYEKNGMKDRGSYIMLFRQNKPGEKYKQGFYVYFSYEEENLEKKIEKYKRKKKTPLSLKEILRSSMVLEMTWPIRTCEKLQDDLFKNFSEVCDFLILKNDYEFLLFSQNNPKLNRKFQNLLLYFRMIRPFKEFHN